MSTGEVIVFYKSIAELDRDWRQLFAEYEAEFTKICREHDLVKAVVNGSTDVLAKASQAEVAFAKSEAARLESELLGSDSIYCLRRLEEFHTKSSAKFTDHNRLRARSERFLRRIGAIR